MKEQLFSEQTSKLFTSPNIFVFSLNINIYTHAGGERKLSNFKELLLYTVRLKKNKACLLFCFVLFFFLFKNLSELEILWKISSYIVEVNSLKIPKNSTIITAFSDSVSLVCLF